MHVFLTGPKNIGKSTIIDKVIKNIDLECGGFLTFYEDHCENPNRQLLMSAPQQGTGLTKKEVVISFLNNKPQFETCKFDEVGVELLTACQDSVELFIMDECGRLEKDSKIFQKTILDILKGNTPVLGVIAHNKPSWILEIINHYNVSVIEVNEENRNDLPLTLLQKFKNTK
ncbi:MAG: nucleoside-triphosphatase [Clostridiales bacterium]